MNENVVTQPAGFTENLDKKVAGNTNSVVGRIEMSFVEYSSMNYQSLTRQIDGLEKQIVGLKENMATNFAAVDTKFAAVEKEIVGLKENMDTNFAAVDKQFAAVDKQFAAVDKQFAAVDKQIDGLEKQMNTKIDGLEKQMNARFESIEVKIDKYNRTLAIFVPIAAIVLPIIVNKLMAYLGL
ncbi:hypothetical protein [Borrelia sp. P9F1]|uniref:hypothetical protein n=1 Tax=Borrelia sp. P9F1 TaxID=3058374 RepID=UPI002647084F|nr:hypothetical protein [Borrelia sp. P9F1]WKC58615.1 hypothetical protein QYZ68_05285 [Borrelia sp. P9F1]